MSVHHGSNMSSHWRPTEPDAPPADDRYDDVDGFGDFDAATGHDLVLAPSPALPTRWDSLDAEPADAPQAPGSGLDRWEPEPVGPAFADTGFHDTGFHDPAFGEPAFGDAAFSEPAFGDAAFSEPAFGDAAFRPDPAFGVAPAVVPGEYPAPLTVSVPVAPAALPPSLLDDLYRVCLRLTGVPSLASSMSREALNSSVTATAPGGEPYRALVDAVRMCIVADLPDEAQIPYHQHRARLRRDLGRRNERDRAILAMRHVIGVPPSGVAARLSVPESQVREAASAWCPDDSRVDSLALLRGIDSWISTDLGSVVPGHVGTELAHLDDVDRPATSTPRR